MPQQSLGSPQITGSTPDELRLSVQFWMQQLFNHVDKLTGLRGTPTIFSDFNANGNAIQHVKTGTQPHDAVVKSQTLTLALNPAIGVEQFNAGNIGIFNVPTGERPQDAVNVGQLDESIQNAIATVLQIIASGGGGTSLSLQQVMAIESLRI